MKSNGFTIVKYGIIAVFLLAIAKNLVVLVQWLGTMLPHIIPSGFFKPSSLPGVLGLTLLLCILTAVVGYAILRGLFYIGCFFQNLFRKATKNKGIL